jgi:galactoside O-acetyltransferase
MSFMSEEEIAAIGFKYVGKDVKISRKASIYNPQNISIDDHTRIDDFAILSAGQGGIKIGKYIHIGCYSSLIGQGAIVMEDLSGVGGRVSIYAIEEDVLGDYMCHPTIPDECRDVRPMDITFKEHSVACAASCIIGKVVVGKGAVIGAMSLVKEDCDDFGIYVGIPAKKVKERTRGFLELRRKYLPDV